MSDTYLFHQKVVMYNGRLRTNGDRQRYDLPVPVTRHNADEKVRGVLHELGHDRFVWAEDEEGRWLYGAYQPVDAWQIHRNGEVEVHLVRPVVLRHQVMLTDQDTRVSFPHFVARLQGMNAAWDAVVDLTSVTPRRILRFRSHQDTYLSFSLRGDDSYVAHLLSHSDEFFVSSNGKSLKIDQRQTHNDPDAIREYRAFEPQFVTKETIGPAVIDPAGIRAARAAQELRVGEEVLDLNHGRVNIAALRELDIRAPMCSLTVNGRSVDVRSPIAYEEVLMLADMRPGASVTYSKGPESNREGTLYKGKLVDVQEGMTFCVAYTDNA